MSAAVLVAIVAAVGNLLQGWDNATMAGGIIYIKREFKWENEPTMEGLTVAMSLIGATLITLCSGGISDWLGRRPMLIISSVFYILSGVLMLWSPNVYLLLFARLLDGFGIGLAVTYVPLYISEMSPPETRGLLSTLPHWRLMLGVLFGPSLVYFALTIFYLPESPRWLMSKGRMLEARQVLQRLRGKEDVSSEMALLVEGLEVGDETSIEEYIIGPPNELPDEEKQNTEKEEIKLFTPEGVSSVVALRRVGNQPKNEEWDEASNAKQDEDYASISETDDSLHSPLISRQTTSNYKMRQGSGHLQSGNAEGIGSGWQLAWKWKEGEEGFQRIYLHEDGVTRSWRDPLDGECTKAAALVSQPALYKKRLMDQHPVGPAMIHPSAAADKEPHWKYLFELGVKHALLVGMGIQMIQQFLGINAVLYYTPQILEQAGVQLLLSDMGISSESSSLLISAIMTLLMLPSVAIAMRLMDVSGRRSLLLNTNPVLTTTLIILVIVRVVHVGSIVKAAVSTASVILYSCFFAMGFGPIPNILCAEIFPTRVRGICIAICVLTFWICNIIVTYTLPVMLSSIGLAGIFSIYAMASIISWAFVYLKVPETKGMPLEVITEFFAMGAKQTTDAKNHGNQGEWDSGNWTSGCVRRVPLSCEGNNGITNGGREEDGFLRLPRMKMSGYSDRWSGTEDQCEGRCLSNCSCIAYGFDDEIRCKKRTSELALAGASGSIDSSFQDALNQANLEELPLFKFEILSNATDRFSEGNKLGKGGFGHVYKGELANVGEKLQLRGCRKLLMVDTR
ncbi:hypothetical protein DH2020_045411 [Rehmannia glutinosa]|uniref:Major facilitator superfamily (MFS) profile domain-containing protein n=1 Tax=Rehmannia glutinosa TaxID=99300 RepID=A0ABR0UEE2_REHGL